MHYHNQFNKPLWDHVDSNPYEKPWTSNVKTEQLPTSSGRPRDIGNMHCFVSYQTEVVNKRLISTLDWNKPLSKLKLHSLIPLKRKSSFMRYLFIGVNGLKTFFTVVKLLNALRSTLCLKERWKILRVNNPKTVRIKDAQFPRSLWYEHLCSAISTSVVVCL